MARYSASDRSTELPAAAATSPDGSTVFVTGFTSWPTGQHDIVTVAYDAITGAKRWVARHDEDLCDLAAALAVAPSGDRVFVAGSIGPECSSSSEDFLTVAYDAATGGQRWEARYDGPGHGQDFILDAGTNVDSSTVFVTGDSVGQVSDNVATIAYDATTGLARWTARYEGPDDNHEFAQRMAVDPAGKAVYVTGTTYTEEGPLVTIAYDAISGTLRWDTQSNGGTSWGLAVAPDGTRVYAAADADGFLAVAYRTDTGAVIGVARFDPDPSDEYVRDIGISPNGRLVFATGFSYRTHSLDDYTTVAFAT
jgi:DNA-binding beta-propeller fold protein YncE